MKAEGKNNYRLQMDMAKKLFMDYDQETLIRKFRLDADETYIRLTYMNTPCRISRQEGHIEEYAEGRWQECDSFNTVMTLYDLLCYHKGPALPPLSEQWCAVGTFVITGVTNTHTFTKNFAKRFDGRLEQLKAACEGLGGALQKPVAGADLTCRFQVTPFFPVLLQFWAGDEDFPPRLLLLWDRNTDQLLHFETTFYLQADLLERLDRAIFKNRA